MKWNFTEVWNQAVLAPQQETKEREYLWASELGGPLADLWLKWKGVEPTNTPDDGVQRKFMAADMWKYIVVSILQNAGLQVETQKEVWTDLGLKVKGYTDLIAGGKPDFEKALESISLSQYDKRLCEMATAMINGLKQRYDGQELETLVLEIKSLSAFAMDKVERIGRPLVGHRYQIAHHLIGTGLQKGHIVYVCRDDCRLKEVEVVNDEQLLTDYKAEIDCIATALAGNVQPAPAPLILVEDGRFIKNFAVEYSRYLTLLYGFKSPADYRNQTQARVTRWNRVLKRLGNGLNLTRRNLGVLEEIRKAGFNPSEVAAG